MTSLRKYAQTIVIVSLIMVFLMLVLMPLLPENPLSFVLIWFGLIGFGVGFMLLPAQGVLAYSIRLLTLINLALFILLFFISIPRQMEGIVRASFYSTAGLLIILYAWRVIRRQSI
jgi:hypothetical protein